MLSKLLLCKLLSLTLTIMTDSVEILNSTNFIEKKNDVICIFEKIACKIECIYTTEKNNGGLSIKTSTYDER